MKRRKKKIKAKRKYRKKVESRRVRKSPDLIPWPKKPTIAQVMYEGMGHDSITDFTAYFNSTEWGEILNKPPQLKTEDDGTFLTEAKVPVRLTPRQVAVIESCCIPPEDYAKNMILRERAEIHDIQRKKEFEFERSRALPEQQGS